MEREYYIQTALLHRQSRDFAKINFFPGIVQKRLYSGEYPPYLSLSEIVGVMPNRQQNDNYCTYLTMCYVDKLEIFLEKLSLGGRDLANLDEQFHLFAKNSYLRAKLAILPRLLADTNSANRTQTSTSSVYNDYALNQARSNILDHIWENRWVNNYRKAWQNIIPKSLGGAPETSQKEMYNFLASLWIPGNIFAITRGQHSYLALLLGEDRLLICDSLWTYRFLVTRLGFFQHFWHADNEALSEDPFLFFDSNDVQIACRTSLLLKTMCR